MKKSKATSSGRSSTNKKKKQTPVAEKRSVDRLLPGADAITQSGAFRRAAIDAEACVRDSKRLRQLVEDAVGKINITPRGPFADTWPYLMAMIRLIRDYQRAEYRDISEPNLVIIIAAILYFVSPFDVIPDWVPVLGHIDDAFVISLALKSVRLDLDTFMAWETARI